MEIKIRGITSDQKAALVSISKKYEYKSMNDYLKMILEKEIYREINSEKENGLSMYETKIIETIEKNTEVILKAIKLLE